MTILVAAILAAILLLAMGLTFSLRNRGRNADRQTLAASVTANPPLDYIRSMPKTQITETLIAALPQLSAELFFEAQRAAKELDLNDVKFVECILDLELVGGFDKILEFTGDKRLASAYVDAIVLSLTGGTCTLPSEMEFRDGGTEAHRGIAKYVAAGDYIDVSFPEAWLFGKEYSQIKSGNAKDLGNIASVAPVVVIILKAGATIFQQALKHW